MRYCSRCGSPTNNDMQKFCLKCGASLLDCTETVQNKDCLYSASLENKYSMKWFKCLIYFGLFLGAIWNFVIGINTIFGTIYYAQSNGEVTPQMVYAIYGTPLKILDKIYGFALVGISIFTVTTRFKLSKFKKEGPKYLYLLSVFNAVLGSCYILGVSVITGDANIFASNFVSSIAIPGFTLWYNYKYFTKRNELFCN